MIKFINYGFAKLIFNGLINDNMQCKNTADGECNFFSHSFDNKNLNQIWHFSIHRK